MSDVKLLFFVGLIGAGTCAWAQRPLMKFTQTIPIASKAYQIMTADINDDLYPDMVVLTNDAFAEAKIYKGTAEGLFIEPYQLVKGENYRVLESGDINADGFDDLVISSYWNNGFKIFWGTGADTFTEGQHYTLTGHGKNTKVYDLNRDGAMDIAALSGGSGQPITLHIYYGNNDQSLTLKGVYGSLLHTDRQITIVDKNLDGLPDIMVSSSFPWFVIFYQQIDGSFIPRYWPFVIEEPFPASHLLADLDLDEKQDVIAYYWDGEFRFYPGMQDTLFSSTYTAMPAPAGAFRIHLVDMDNDGLIDLITDRYNEHTDEPSDSLFIYLNKGDFTFAEPTILRFPGVVEYFITGDLDSDNLPDIAASCKNVGIVIASNDSRVLGSADQVASSVASFPNPFTDQLTIPISQEAEVVIYSNQGLIYSTTKSGEDVMLNTSTWPKGIYYVRVITKKEAVWNKVIKY